MDRDRPVRVRRGIVWIGAPALMLLIKLCIDAKHPSIVAQVRSELYIRAAMLWQTVVMVRPFPQEVSRKAQAGGTFRSNG